MLVGQFKRAQSNLQEVMHTAKKLPSRFEKDFGTDNLLSYLDIYGDNEIYGRFRKRMAGNSYEFEELEGRTLGT
jgi:hypothetical protein